MQKQNRKQKVSSIFIDFEKAFDKVNHVYLLYKLNTLKIPKYLLHIITSFLTDRSLNALPFNIRAGVPQGSCHSPILFSLFFSDILIDSSCNLSQFADDLATWATNTKKNKIYPTKIPRNTK